MRPGLELVNGQRAFGVSGVLRKPIEGVSLMTQAVRGYMRCSLWTMPQAAFMQCGINAV